MDLKYKKLIPFLVVTFIVTVEAAISFNSTLLPNIKAHFVVSDQMVQWTVSGTLLALGFSGFLYGGLSDCMGRRPLFIFSTILFSIGAILSATTSHIGLFLAARVIQGFGSGAGWVVGNACLKDIFHGKDYVRVMNYTHAIAGIIPAVAPVLGSYVAVSLGWRHCFFLLFFFSLFSALGMYFFQPETLSQKSKPKLGRILKDYKSVILDATFVKYLTVKVALVMLLFCEISTLPLVLVDYMGINPKYYGFYLLPAFAVYVLSSVVASKINRYRPVDFVLNIGLTLILVSNIILIALSKTDLTPLHIMLIKSLTYMGWGFVFGNATSQVVSAVPGKAGMSSALMIALEMLFSGLGISFIGFFFNGTMIPLSLFMVITALMGLVVMRIGRYRLVAHSA